VGLPAPSRSGARVQNGIDDAPLAGLRVLDLTAFWAGPFATNVLALLGADVVKVESVNRPDGMRFVNVKPGPPLWEAGSIFHGANSEKRAVTLRLDREEGRRLLRALVERADALVENFSARVLDQFDLGWQTLSAWNPRLVLVRMPAWGLTGPWRDRTGFAMNVEQACGIA
jgi:crotonobetainyl-CoA:carnitine CoA-transferase CaiB-like acyl-CoA transferase